MSQLVIVSTFWPDVAPTLQGKERMLPMYTLLASPVGVLTAWWAFRAPNSKRVFSVAVCLGLSGFVLALIIVAFFGLE